MDWYRLGYFKVFCVALDFDFKKIRRLNKGKINVTVPKAMLNVMVTSTQVKAATLYMA